MANTEGKGFPVYWMGNIIAYFEPIGSENLNMYGKWIPIENTENPSTFLQAVANGDAPTITINSQNFIFIEFWEDTPDWVELRMILD